MRSSRCESYFFMVHPNSKHPALLERLTENLGSLVSSSGFWLPIWIFSKYETAESSVQPLSYPPSTLICKLLATHFYSDLQAFCPVTLTNQEGNAKCGAPFSVLPFSSGSWRKSPFSSHSWETAKSCAWHLSLLALHGWWKSQCLEGKSSWEYLTHFCAFPFSPGPWPSSLGCIEISPSCFVVFYPSFLVVLGRLLVWYK